MGKLSIDQVQPGMKLEKDVRERSGRTLLRAGTEMTDRQLGILKTWGVVEVEIESTCEDVHTQRREDWDPALLAATEEELAPLFVRSDRDHPAMKELIKLVVLRRAKIAAARIASVR